MLVLAIIEAVLLSSRVLFWAPPGDMGDIPSRRGDVGGGGDADLRPPDAPPIIPGIILATPFTK